MATDIVVAIAKCEQNIQDLKKKKEDFVELWQKSDSTLSHNSIMIGQKSKETED